MSGMQSLGVKAGTLLALALACAQAAPPAGAHPGWDVINLRPNDTFKPMVTGMGFLSDGSMVVSHWGGKHADVDQRQFGGAVYIVKGVLGDNPKTSVTTFADKLEDPVGLLVENDHIYLSGGNDLLELLDANKDGVMDGKKTIYHVPGTHGRHEFLYGVLHRNGKFYILPSSANIGNDTQVNPNRGVLLEIDSVTAKADVLSMGFRQPNGIGEGPEGELFSVDVQGNWVPDNELNHLQKGHFYGYKHEPAETWDNMKVTPPAVHLPEAEVSSAPGNPLYIDKGIYAGQLFLGDVSVGGIRRIFLEKVNGDFQGCVFFHSGGLEAGVERLMWGPDGMLYVGMCGQGSGWSYKQDFGLQKMKPNGKSVFEMLSVRSRPTGMEIEFTEPVGTMAADRTKYQVKTWTYTSTANYNNPPQGIQTLTPKSVMVSPDGMKVFLEIPELALNRVVYIGLSGDFASKAGGAVWTKETWYTLNAFGSGKPFDPVATLPGPRSRDNDLRVTAENGLLKVHAVSDRPQVLRVYDMLGCLRIEKLSDGIEDHRISTGDWGKGIYFIQLGNEKSSQLRRIALP